MLDIGFLEFQFVGLFLHICIHFLGIFDHVNLALLERILSTLKIDGPPTTDETLVKFIDTDLRYLTHLARRVTLNEVQDLLILPRFFLLIVVVFDFNYVKSEVLVVDFFFRDNLVIIMRIEVVLLVNVQKLVLTRLPHQIVRKYLLLVSGGEGLIGFDEVLYETFADESRILISKHIFDISNFDLLFFFCTRVTNLGFDVHTIIVIHLTQIVLDFQHIFEL